MQLTPDFFDCDAQHLAKKLLGKIIRRQYHNQWLAARIIETEAYYLHDRGSHASLGYTDKRKALFMPAGTIYMYYARGKDSLNISCQGEGNAVLIKSAIFHCDEKCHSHSLKIMQSLNPQISGQPRMASKLCAGQTLLCRALDIKVKDWDQQAFKRNQLFIDDIGYSVTSIIQTTRLGIPHDRDEHLMYRFIDEADARHCSKNPLTQRKPNFIRLNNE